MRKVYTSFDAGERPAWDNGKIDSPAYQLGFDVAENVLFEDGIVRKRLGVHSITKKADLSAHTPSGEPFIPGYGPYAWDKTGFYSFFGSGNRAAATDYKYTPVTFAPAITTPSWAWNSLVSYRESTGKDEIFIYDPTGSTVVEEKGEFAIEAAGRRFFLRQLPANTKKIEVHASRAGSLEDFSYQDGNSGATTLYPSDPIDVNLSSIGKILWVSEGFGLFIGTDRGVYELVNGLGVGFSPQNGGFFPNSLGNYFTMPLIHGLSKARNQCVTMTQESVVFTTDVDTVMSFNRRVKAAQKLKLDVPATHAIDSMAWVGGNLAAVLLAEITPRASWGANAYNAVNNIVLIINETNGVVSRITGLSPFTIAGSGGSGLIFKSSDGTTVKAGAIPYRSLERYGSTPVAFDPSTFYDYTATPYTARLVTMPLNFGADLGDERVVVTAKIRVNQSRSFSVRQITSAGPQELRTWTYEVAAPALFSGDVTVTLNSSTDEFVQLEISDAGSYPLEILAIQIDYTINQAEGGPA